jgi:hypothetical protein
MAKEGLAPFTVEKQHSPLLPSSRGQGTALPVKPVNNRGLVPAAIGDATASSAAKNTATLNGTSLKLKP